MALMHRRMSDARRGKAQAILDAKVEIIELKKCFQAKIRDLNIEANYQIQWF